MNRMITLATLLAALAVAPLASAERGLFSEGKQSFGLGLGGGGDSFVFAGGYGYFISDGLKPSTSVRFTWSRSGDATSKQLDWEVGARYYFTEPKPISPLAHVFTTVTRLGYEHTVVDGNYTYYNVGVAGGIFMLVGRSIGIEVTGGVVQYMGVDPELLDHDVVPDEPDPFYRLGVSLMF
jgi:hypothetical protein